jgi:hypothetical protein
MISLWWGKKSRPLQHRYKKDNEREQCRFLKGFRPQGALRIFATPPLLLSLRATLFGLNLVEWSHCNPHPYRPLVRDSEEILGHAEYSFPSLARKATR